jgi:creatinine amidohydrolase
MGTDAFAAIALAEQAARKFGTVVVPLPLVGVSPYHRPWVGSLTFKPQTFLAVVDDICECLDAHGVKKLLFVNWHEGNSPTLKLAAGNAQIKYGFRAVIAEGHLITNSLFGERAPLTHAGEMETAAAMMYDPSLVDVSKATNPTPEEEGDEGHEIFRQKLVYPILHDFREVAETGWYGKPEVATLELAAEYLEKVSEYIVEKAQIEFDRERSF